MHQHSDPTRRFSTRVDDYARYRPGYPEQVWTILAAETGLTSASLIADIGAGTGISSELFLKKGNRVFAVEPNKEMRQASEERLSRYSQFQSVNGRAESTTLNAESIDYVIAAQTFHWFDSKQNT